MCRAPRFVSDVGLRDAVRERPLAALLATLVAGRREEADLTLFRGDLTVAADLGEASALAIHQLGLLKDAILAILRGRRDGLD